LLVALGVAASVLAGSLALREARAGSGTAASMGQAAATGEATRAGSVPAAASQAAASPSATPWKQMPIPVRIAVPVIGVDARVIPLGLNPDRTMEVPTNLADTGWFRPGPEPGEQGAAVIVGHLNSRRGPGVFARLSRVKAGAAIRVRLRDGSTVKFVARSAMRVAKNRFPTKLVYARTPRPTLRLITCAGRLNPATGHHDDNYIVFASIVS
jgi:sortase (surface protein transpeptidase)